MFDNNLNLIDASIFSGHRTKVSTRKFIDDELLLSKFCNADGDGGDGGGDGDGPSSSPSDSESPGASLDGLDAFSGYEMCGPPVTDSYGNPVFDGSGNFVTTEPWNSGAYSGGGNDVTPQEIVVYIPWGPKSGVYDGSLSSLGNMVAMCIADASWMLRVVTPGQTSNGWVNVGDYISSSNAPADYGTAEVVYAPFSTGYFREYWGNPTSCTFGADSAIPALTGVMPSGFSDMPGNFVYYVDLQLQRVSGSNTWNDQFFMNSFNQALGWVLTANNYLASLDVSQKTDLSYYGASDYSSLTTQGFDVYKKGDALRAALRNLGLTIGLIPEGHFGTPNAVAKSIIDNGAGAINNFSAEISRQGVIYDDIYNENYTSIITAELEKITNPSDLSVIQSVLESSISNMASAMDYTRINIAAGMPNDSDFETLAAFGQDIFKKAPNLQVSNGSALAALIDLVQNEVSANVNSVAGENGALLSQDIIDGLKTYLPIGVDGGPVSLVNVIGCASGYLFDGIKAVNDGIERLYATDYGVQLRNILTDISRFFTGYALTESETKLTDADWQSMLEDKKAEYLNLVDQIASDQTGDIPVIVQQINDNYLWCCQNLYWENKNWEKAKLTVGDFGETSQYLNFVSAMPNYGADVNNVGTDYVLYGLCQPNKAGDVAKTVLGQAKTNYILANAGVKITGVL